MNTQLITINPDNPDSSLIAQAARVIKNGGLVSFPTETIYGLGANGLDPEAVKKIFLAKGRPQDNPLILHVASVEQVTDLVQEIPESAKLLMNKFWPGPLTLIFKKSDLVPDSVSCGLDTVAVRMPDNKVALELINACGCPLSAPSANISGRPSPTQAIHVMDDLSGKVDMVLDGGEVDIGIESTVLDLTQTPPQILRPGKVTQEDIEGLLGPIGEHLKSNTPRAPGMKYTHYSPSAKVFIVHSQEEENVFLKNNPDKKIMILNYADEKEMASNLFKDFREADKKCFDCIVVYAITETSFGRAIMDRLKKASEK